IMHFAELKHDIPKIYYKKENNFIFSSDSTDKNFLYIPSADGKKYRTKFLKYHHNITFCGNPAFYNREKILSQIILNFGRISIFCKSYDFYKSLDEIYKNGLLNNYHLELFRDSYKGYVESQQELAQIFISSKINIDMPSGGIKPYNYRCIEIMASGGFLITPFSNQLIKQFDDGKELETYNTESELIDKIAFYLENVNISRLIASKGKKNVLSSCSFYDRLKKGLKVIYDKNSCNR
ncbi:MAG: glycosyltransferase, partial [Candidatus Gastranaerophilales bacterium]|nr:glycosyltransferase [Candidatus Gastranaerophilales bacterium]